VLHDQSPAHSVIMQSNDDLKALRQELAALLEDDDKADKLRSLPFFV
jgi:hypothetical protein